jgi:hypothetical protein
VPAAPSSPIPIALAHLSHADPLQFQDADAPHLLADLAAVPDPRVARGRRHRLVAILGLADRDREQERPRPPTSRWRAVAVDGKTLRGARGAGADGRPVHLLACMDHAFGFPHAAQVLQVTRKRKVAASHASTSTSVGGGGP